MQQLSFQWFYIFSEITGHAHPSAAPWQHASSRGGGAVLPCRYFLQAPCIMVPLLREVVEDTIGQLDYIVIEEIQEEATTPTTPKRTMPLSKNWSPDYKALTP